MGNPLPASFLFFPLSRAAWLTSLILLWMVLLFLPLVNFTVYPARMQYLLLGREIGWRTGFFQGSRGRLLDRDGNVLAWSERSFDLELLHRVTPERREAVDQALQMVFLRHAPPTPEVPGLVKKELSPDEFNRYAAVQEQLPEFRLTSRTTRMILKPSLQRVIGEVRNKNGITSGLSGWELRYDRRLRGKIGFFTVMTDKYGKWIPDTWQALRMPAPGQDITLEYSLDELLTPAGTGGGRRP